MPNRRSAKDPAKRSRPLDFALVHDRLRAFLGNPREARFLIGAILALVHDQKLYRQAGLPTFHAYLDSLTVASRRTWQRYMALARQVEPTLALMVPGDRLELAMRLLGRKRRRVYVNAAALQALEIEVLRDGQCMRVPFEEASNEDLADAVSERR